MSIANLLTQNNYNIEISSESKKTLKVILGADYNQASASTTTIFGVSPSTAYITKWNQGNYIINSTNGAIQVPVSGKYNIVLKVSYRNNGNNITRSAENVIFSTLSNGYVAEFTTYYMNINVGDLVQRNYTACVELLANTDYVFKHYLETSAICQYYGSSTLDYTSITIEFIGE